ncbi:hypothetical protein N9J92_02315 [Polaribacter sp.]|nr:hypothetical protein [Polaribacter sp.]MDA9092675.1 hypothetical protein [Polaribacter sp.]
MSKTALFVFLFVFTLNGMVAQRSTLITGHLKDSIGSISNATILNLSSKRGTISNDEGIFEIRVRLGDSLRLSSVQHVTKIIYISKATFIRKRVAIQLFIETTVLDAFELKKHDLSGRLGIDVQKVIKEDKISAITLGLPNAGRKKLKKVDREIYTATTSSGGISLDHIINTLSGRIKMLRKKKVIVEEDIDVQILLKQYNYDLEKNFKIQKDATTRFLYFCRTDSLFKKTLFNNEFALIKFLEQKAIEFNKLNSNLAR